jgi:hypothetical protein
LAENARAEEVAPRRSRRKRSRLPIPFVTTGTATDLGLAFALLPLWWVLGIDQLVWLPLALFILLKRRFVEKRLRVERVALVLLLAFGVSYLLSGLNSAKIFSPEADRLQSILPYFLNAVTYAAAGIFLLLAADCARRERERMRVLQGIGFMALVATVIGVLPYLGLPLRFEAPVGYFFSGLSMDSMAIFQRMSERFLGNETCFLGYEVFRAKSIFFYSTLYATALAMTAPIQAYLALTSRGGWRVLWAAAVILSLVGIPLATARGAAAALLVSAGAVALLWALHAFRSRRGQRLRLALTTVSVLGVGLIVAVLAFQAVKAVAGGADLQECGARAKATETGERQPTAAGGGLFSLVETGLNARGGSLRARLGIYEASIESWKKRPVLGWAMQRYGGVGLPLGSHSVYLGTLYQRGILGLAVLLALIGYAFWRLIGGFRRSNDARLKLFLGCAAVSCGAASLAGILDILDVDVIVQVLYWTLLGLIIGAAASAGRDDAGEESGDGP